MKPVESLERFQTLIAAVGVDVRSLEPSRGVELMCDFYLRERIATEDPDCDMLLFQWGIFDWQNGEGERFELDITRQFIWSSWWARLLFVRLLHWDPTDLDQMSQLHMKFRWPPTDQLRSLGDGNFWSNEPGGFVAFKERILSTPAYQTVGSWQTAAAVEFGLV